jgi:predicted lipoprotein
MFKKPSMANLALREAGLSAWPALAFAAVLVAATNVALAQQRRPATPGSAAQVRFKQERHHRNQWE